MSIRDTSPPAAQSPTPEPHTYADRETGALYKDAFEMTNAFLTRFSEHASLSAVVQLDATGYAQVKRGSASIGLNVLEENGVLMLLAPIATVPPPGKGNREAFYRRLLELSFLATADAAFAIDAGKDVVYVRALRRLSGLDYEEFEDLLVTVGAVADEWDDKLKTEFGVSDV